MADVGFQMDQSELNEAELASLNPKSDYLKSDIRYILFPSMIFTFCRRYADALALLALALICAVIFWPLWHGQAYYLGDIQLYFQPMATQWKAALDGGRVPLWNNGILAGTPFVGNPQIWVLYPASLLFLAFPAMQALALTTLFHFWLAGAFFYGWTRRGRLDLHPVAAFLGACVWMLCGFFVAKTQFPNMFMAIAWMPAVLWAGEGVIERGSARATLVLSLVLGLQLATAHAQISLFTIYMMGAYALYLWRATPHPEASRRGNGWRVASLFGGALLLMGLLTLGQTLPVVDVVRAAARQKLGLRRASRFIFVPWAIITLVWPYFYGDPMKDSWNYPLYMNIWETVAYLGIVPLVLVGVAVVNDLRARFWLNWSLIFLWLSMGLFGGLYILVFKLLPGINRFHDPARFLSGYSLGVAVLAALGAHYLWKHARRGRWLALGALALTLADAGYFARHFLSVFAGCRHRNQTRRAVGRRSADEKSAGAVLHAQLWRRVGRSAKIRQMARRRPREHAAALPEQPLQSSSPGRLPGRFGLRTALRYEYGRAHRCAGLQTRRHAFRSEIGRADGTRQHPQSATVPQDAVARDRRYEVGLYQSVESR